MVIDKRESEVSTRYLVLLSKCFTSSVQYLVLYLVQLLLTSTGRYRASISLSGSYWYQGALPHPSTIQVPTQVHYVLLHTIMLKMHFPAAPCLP